MKHLIVCREFPPAVYPPGGIGTYAAHISRVLAEHGETVHVIGQRWDGASRRIERLCDDRLVIHRIAAEDSELFPSVAGGEAAATEVREMLRSDFPQQWFSWVAAGLAERLVSEEGIDVIEGQEWEAPLYYFLLRRALGLGPERKPPCLVHLHSPTEFIFRHNDWPLSRPDYHPMKRLEDYVIKAADGHLCPSSFLARECTAHYGLDEPIEVIPLPLGTNPVQIRTPDVWARGSIVFVGRLEPRKGVIEFADAAISVAREDPSLRFEFIGSDNEFNERIGVRQLIEQRIPEDLKKAFVFHGSRPRSEVLARIGEARIAVVPSRWENFPNTCLEAMSSGLPVLATRNGGMAEMIEDEVTGWLADDGPAPLADRLAVALRRAVATPPGALAEMGARAATSIRAICDDAHIAERHIAVRARARLRGAHRSTSFPAVYPWPHFATRPVPERRAAAASSGTAVAVLADGRSDPRPTLESLAAQTRKPSSIIVVSQVPPQTDLPYVHVAHAGTFGAIARSRALEAAPDAAHWMFVPAGMRLESRAIETLEDALAHAPGAGLAAAWIEASGARAPLNPAPPSFPYQWARDEGQGPAILRRAAIAEAGGFRPDISPGHEDWDLGSAIMAAGWSALRVPAMLARSGVGAATAEGGSGSACHARVQIARRFPELAGRDALALLHLLEPPPSTAAPKGAESDVVERPALQTGMQRIGRALRRPDQTARRLVRRIRSRIETWENRRA